MRRWLVHGFLAAVPAIGLAQTPCDQLKSLKLVNTTITATESAGPGPYQLPPPATIALVVPAFCRVAATLRPSADSEIKIEVWLPAAWNGKYLAVGGGGWVGSINYGAMTAALQGGYATSATDTGHTGGTADFAVGHPEKVTDFAYRAVHEMTVKAKAITAAHFGRSPRLSYWTGCSTGGWQGLLEAQRYPADFDGIIAGAASINQIQLSAWQFALETAVLKDPARVVPPAKANLVNRAVLAACDALDGLRDGFLSDPQKCRFDPSTLLCRSQVQTAADCLTAPQLESVKQAFAPARKKTGEQIYPGLVPGSEAGWQFLFALQPEPNMFDLGMFRLVAHEDPAWDWRLFDLDQDLALAEQKAGSMTAVNPDLSPFKSRGGKLLIYHGWNDAAGGVSPLNTLDYYSSVLAKMGKNQDNWFRLFMVPGMGHCGGGPGPNQFNMLGAIERWRESGAAPDQIIASHVTNNRVDMTRPLCPYPKVAVYNGVGSTNDAANFTCKQ